MKENIFYVYEHWRADKGECFYVGKGKGGRAYDFRGRHAHHKNISAKLKNMGMKPEVRFAGINLSEQEAFELEIARIAFWKSRAVNLINKTEGGEGVSGFKYTPESIAKMSKSAKERCADPIERKRRSEVAKRRMANPDARKNLSKVIAELMADPARRSVISAAMKKRMSDPEARSVISESNRKREFTAETLAKHSRNLKERMADPVIKEKVRQATIARHRANREAKIAASLEPAA